MKAIKYIIGLSALLIGITSCEKLSESEAQEKVERKWPELISTAEAGDFVLVRRDTAGFTMGDANLTTSSPVHTVKFSKSFYMCKTEVTQAQWKAVMGNNPSDNQGLIKEGTNADNCPVNNISIEDAKNFVKALNAATGRTFAIPTEAQWEWAAMGGKLSNGYTLSGSNEMSEVAWNSNNSESYLNEVGKLKANELGIYDMSGNVEEWVADKYATYKATEVTDPTGGTSGNFYVSRGGNLLDSNADILSVRARNKNKNTDKKYTIGLRLIIEEPLSTDK
jgi:formylglycine-generating enzyme required for sulfatase activity